jgi:hypothetical protein
MRVANGDRRTITPRQCDGAIELSADHMGSAMTSNLFGMQKVMQALERYNLYFLDSVTIGQCDGAIELSADVRLVLGVVEKHFAFNHLHAGTLGGAHGRYEQR